MPDSTNTTYTNVADLPDYIKPYYKALLNGITGQIFTPQYLASQGMGSIPAGSGDWTTPAPNPTPTPTQPVVEPTAQQQFMLRYMAPVQTASSGIAAIRNNTPYTPVDQMTQRGMVDPQALLGDPIFGRQRMDGGGLVVDPMRTSTIGGNATLSGVGTPVELGTQDPLSILTGQPGGVVNIGQNNYPTGQALPYTPYTGIPRTGGGQQTGGVGIGAIPWSPANPGAGGSLPSGAVVPQISSSVGDALGIQRAGTYHMPDVSPERAAELAKIVGGRGIGEVAPTQGPFAYTPQSLVDMGNELYMNSGLLEQTLKDPNAVARIRDEVAAHDRTKAMTPDQRYASMQSGVTGRFARGGIASIGKARTQKRYNVGGWTAGEDPGTGTTPTTQPTATPASFGAGVFQPYQPYGGQRILNSDPSKAGPNTWSISNRTQAAEAGLSSLPSYLGSNGRIENPELGYARDLMSYAGDKSGDMYSELSNLANSYAPENTSIRSQYQQSVYNPSTFSSSGVDPSKLQIGSSGSIQMSPLTMYQTQNPQMFDSGIASGYMSPYQRAVTDVNKQAVVRDFGEAKTGRDAQAVRAGAFGGSRQAVSDSLANRDMQRQLAEIEATGNQSAFTNAQAQFERDRAAQMGADTTNLGSALQTQGLNTQAQLEAARANQSARQGEFSTLFGGQLQAGLANQSAELQRQQMEEASRQFGANYGDQSARFADTQQLSAQELNNRLRQSALGLGQNSINQMNQVGGNYADLSRLAQQMEIQRLQQQQGVGQTEDQRRQAQLDLGYQDFINQQNYPFQLGNYYSGILRGVPTQMNQEGVQLSQANYNPLSQGLGIASGLAGIFGSYKNGGG